MKIEDLKDLDIGKEHLFVDQLGRRVMIRADQDEFCDNPLEDMDAQGRIYSFSRKHVSCIDEALPPNVADLPKFLDRKFGKGLWVLLSYFEHGNCLWFPKADERTRSMLSGDFRWDGVTTAGVWVPDKCLKDDLRAAMKRNKLTRDQQLWQWAKEACDLFTCYCNGEAYCYAVEVQGEELDSCGGYWGNDTDYMWECVREHLAHHKVTTLTPVDEFVESTDEVEALALQHS